MAIRPAFESEFRDILDVWESSVRATHGFLSEKDLGELRPQIPDEWLPAVSVSVYTDSNGRILGFSGVADKKLAMLFVTPTACGRGIGKALLNHAVLTMSVHLVDVNEQNTQAVGFYRHAGFEVFGRSPVDGQGKPYPLLHMRVAPSHHIQSSHALRGMADGTHDTDQQ